MQKEGVQGMGDKVNYHVRSNLNCNNSKAHTLKKSKQTKNKRLLKCEKASFNLQNVF